MQRLELQLNPFKPIRKVVTQNVRCHHVVEATVRGKNKADISFHRVSAADAAIDFVLDERDEFPLQLFVDALKLVNKQGALLGFLHEAPLFNCAGIGTGNSPEEFGLNELRGGEVAWGDAHELAGAS